MTATTAKPVYRWAGGPEHYVLKKGDDAIASVGYQFGSWCWHAKNEIQVGFSTDSAAKAACEKAMGVTTQDVQEDQPRTLSWIGEGPFFGVTKDGSKVGFVSEIHSSKWVCHLYRNGDGGYAASAALAKDLLECAWRKLYLPTDQPTPAPRCSVCGWPLVEESKDGCTVGSCSQRPVPKQEDQPAVIVPPNGLADALDAHAATVTEEDAEATDSKVRNSIQEARKKIWGDRIGEAEDAEARHAAAMAQQVGGSHYRLMKIQPAEFIHANSIPHREASAIELLCRWRAKNGIEDLRKAIHQIELLIDLEEVSQWKATASRAVVGKGKAGRSNG